MRAVAFTGHRPAELGSYNPEDLKPLLWELRRVIVDHIENKDVDTFYGGNALGWDLWSQKIVIKLKETYPHIKLISCIPCRGQQKQWPKQSQEEWQYVVDNSDEVVLVTDDDYKPYYMEIRNRYMVDNADFIIAGYNGAEKGGTANCVKYARQKNKEITIINPNDFK